MPRLMAPPPSGEFNIKLVRPFSGPATHTVEIIGELNRASTVKLSNASGGGSTLEKTGLMPQYAPSLHPIYLYSMMRV